MGTAATNPSRILPIVLRTPCDELAQSQCPSARLQCSEGSVSPQTAGGLRGGFPWTTAALWRFTGFPGTFLRKWSLSEASVSSPSGAGKPAPTTEENICIESHFYATCFTICYYLVCISTRTFERFVLVQKFCVHQHSIQMRPTHPAFTQPPRTALAPRCYNTQTGH